MKRPGGRLRSFAARFCSATTMERLIDPLIADLQCEHAEAVRRGAARRALWIRIASCVAFWRVVSIRAIERSVDGEYEWTAADGWAVGRMLGFVAAATVIVALLLNWVALYPEGPSARLFLLLIPSAFPLAIAVGVLSGILYAMRLRTVTKRVRNAALMIATFGTLSSFGTLSWIIPASNQAYREAFSGIPPQALSKGLNELTLPELRQEMDKLSNGGMRGSVQERDVTVTYYMRFALSVTPIVFGLWALGLLSIGRLERSRVALGAVAVMTCLAYYVLLFVSRAAVFDGWTPAVVWTPNLVFAVGTVLLKLTKVRLKPDTTY